MKVVFLDIDGVIQPLGKQDRFKHLDEIEEIAKALDQKIPGFNYYEYVSEEKYPESFFGVYSRKCNLCAVLFDWPKGAVRYLTEVLERQNAKIVISSDWRDSGSRIIKAFLAVWNLTSFFTACLTVAHSKNLQKGRLVQEIISQKNLADTPLTVGLLTFGIIWTVTVK